MSESELLVIGKVGEKFHVLIMPCRALAGELRISLKVLAKVMGLDIGKLPDDEA